VDGTGSRSCPIVRYGIRGLKFRVAFKKKEHSKRLHKVPRSSRCQQVAAGDDSDHDDLLI
jgi:hypothetical protein